MDDYDDDGGNYSANGSIKTVYRYDITTRVIMSNEAAADVVSRLKYHGVDRRVRDLYETFYNSVFSLYQSTIDFIFDVKDNMKSSENEEAGLLIRDFFASPIPRDPAELQQHINAAIDVFEDYKHALSNSGFYNPLMYMQIDNPAAAFRESC